VTTEALLPDEIRPVMESGIPAQVGTCSSDGIPNATEISRVYYVDPRHVALSNQFFSKTVRNIRENPHACVNLNDVEGCTNWLLHLEFDHSETEGPTFDEMDMQIEAIASMTGMSAVFKLRAADIYRVTSVEKIEFGSES
jgi:flavin reductase (DIM6/NTAB) family NADH-FMN oxidoreductase RutF